MSYYKSVMAGNIERSELDMDDILVRISYAKSSTLKREDMEAFIKDPDYRVRSAIASNIILPASLAIQLLQWEIEHDKNKWVLQSMLNNSTLSLTMKNRIISYLV